MMILTYQNIKKDKFLASYKRPTFKKMLSVYKNLPRMKFLLIISVILFGVTLTNAIPAEFPSKLSQPRIIGGSKAVEKQFPYQVGISIKFGESAFSVCGGSVISDSWVLTAAHCISG